MAKRRRVYLARHGDAAYFGSDAASASDDPDLSDRGVAEAEALGRLLAEAPLDLAVATGLRRTIRTAKLAIGTRELDIEILPGLSEAKSGTFEDVETEEEMETLITRAFEGAEAPGARFLTGDTYASVWDRAKAAWQQLIARDDWSCALVACHGVVNRTLLAQALGAGPEIYRRLEQDSGCLNIVDIDGHGDDASVAYVRLVNFTPYNSTKAGMLDTSLEVLWRQFMGD